MGVGIGLGCAEFPFSGAAAYWRWIDMCEAGGVDSIWQTDRIVGRQPFLESMTTMAALAGRTRRMRFGMNVVSLAFRDPVLLAKQCATIDMLSEGRLLPAFGIGSPLAPEWQALGIDTRTRGRKTDECLDIIRRLWREDSVDFSRAFYQLKGVTIAPRPVQPDLPMWIGGSTDAAIRRTARIGTGWQAGGDPPADAGRVVAAIKAAAREAGRSIDEDHYGAGFAFHFGSQDAPAVAKAMDAYAKRAPGVPPATRSQSATPIRYSRALPNMLTPVCPNSFCARSAAMTTHFWRKPGSSSNRCCRARKRAGRNAQRRAIHNEKREATMRIGGAMFFTDYSMSPTELARALEERGFDSLWVPEHSHIPLSRKSPFPSGGDMPKKYYDVMDPFVMLGAAAAVTKTLLLGTGICLIAQRDPIQTAKQVASIDQISNGRFLFGIGNGWNEDEMANHGTVFETRHKLARERVEAMKEIWTKSKAEYHGEFVNFDPMMTLPKPVQKPHPPVIVGGAFPFGARRALRYGDGWMPHRTRSSYADVQTLLPKFREMAAEAGRDLASVPITIWGARENLDLLERDRDDGVSRLVVSLDSAKADAILPELDRWASLIRQLGS